MDLKIWLICILFSHENNMPNISNYNTFLFSRYAHVRYVKCVFTSILKQQKILTIILLLRNFQTRMRIFQGIVFIWTQEYSEIFKSALVHLKGIR